MNTYMHVNTLSLSHTHIHTQQIIKCNVQGMQGYFCKIVMVRKQGLPLVLLVLNVPGQFVCACVYVCVRACVCVCVSECDQYSCSCSV